MRLFHKLQKARLLYKAKILNNGIKVFWWRKNKNFGDLLTPELFCSYGYTPLYSDVKEADIVVVGSLIHMLPSDYSGIILGTGLIDDTKASLKYAKFVSVRGELSKKNLELPLSTPTGDMGLLAGRLLRSRLVKKEYSVGIVPHFVDKNNPWLTEKKIELGASGCIIDVQNSAKNVISCISKCDLIVSSSLHGIIVADALGIPNVWIELSDKVIGTGFKFDDYNSSIDYEQIPFRVKPTTKIIELELSKSNKNSDRISEKINQLDSLFRKTLLSIGNNKRN
ncbi:polysaccharide pyruvyl transferase family protein [Desulfuromonas acetexigens]|uniref:Polysaccharide pyruvyl transferase family protein n=1 Tax=Trichloromonas acetexigens TaxID=38815 RepID=A0A550JJG1_9BACT|nr:polysaccharide pyruvyl transferase family protein [Desulfuromonas acetexigens]TRO83356.1 polysaccharide pyruvyl transferase family protein [Desulfuromonas acetexigens]